MFKLRLLPAIAFVIVVSLAVTLAKPNPKYVFIISLDQGGDDAIEKADNRPAFHEMVNGRASTWNAQTIPPGIIL